MATTPYGSYATTLGLSALSIGTSLYDQRQQAKAVSDATDSEREAFLYNQNMTVEEIANIDQQLSMVMSQTDIDSMKAEASLRAMNSASGLSGNITKDVVAQASQARAQADTQVVSQARQQQSKLLASMVDSEITYKNKLSALGSQLLSPESAALKTLGAGIQGFQSGINFLTPTQKNNLLGS